MSGNVSGPPLRLQIGIGAISYNAARTVAAELRETAFALGLQCPLRSLRQQAARYGRLDSLKRARPSSLGWTGRSAYPTVRLRLAQFRVILRG